MCKTYSLPALPADLPAVLRLAACTSAAGGATATNVLLIISVCKYSIDDTLPTDPPSSPSV